MNSWFFLSFCSHDKIVKKQTLVRIRKLSSTAYRITLCIEGDRDNLQKPFENTNNDIGDIVLGFYGCIFTIWGW